MGRSVSLSSVGVATAGTLDAARSLIRVGSRNYQQGDDREVAGTGRGEGESQLAQCAENCGDGQRRPASPRGSGNQRSSLLMPGKPCIVAGQGVARPDADRRIASKLAVPRHRREKSCHQSYDQQPENERNDTYWIHLPSVLRGLLEKPFYQSRF